jgi:hypothetical protein
MSDREVELPELLEITDACFVEQVVVPEQVRLPNVTLPKTVKDRFRDALVAIADCVNDRLALAREFVRVRSVFERQLSARGDDATVRRNLERLAHRRIQLRRLRLVTVDARFAAYVPNAVRV